MSIVFGCKLCENCHPATEVLDCGVIKLPNTITTSRDKDQKWYFHCVNCETDKKGS